MSARVPFAYYLEHLPMFDFVLIGHSQGIFVLMPRCFKNDVDTFPSVRSR